MLGGDARGHHSPDVSRLGPEVLAGLLPSRKAAAMQIVPTKVMSHQSNPVSTSQSR